LAEFPKQFFLIPIFYFRRVSTNKLRGINNKEGWELSKDEKKDKKRERGITMGERAIHPFLLQIECNDESEDYETTYLQL